MEEKKGRKAVEMRLKVTCCTETECEAATPCQRPLLATTTKHRNNNYLYSSTYSVSNSTISFPYRWPAKTDQFAQRGVPESVLVAACFLQRMSNSGHVGK
jgi:hypothetical protein